MTTSNIVEVRSQNGNGEHEKTPEEIQLEIARTRTAITEDLLALSEKLSPQHLREGAREVMHSAREEAKEMIREAKDKAVDSLLGMKDKAVETVSQKVGVLGTQARRASGLTVDFMSANAVLVSIVGFGTGLLLVALRRRGRQPRGKFVYSYDYRGPEVPRDEQRTSRRLPEQVRGMASQASRAVDHAREQVRSASSRAGHTASDLGHRAGETMRRAATRTREVAGDNRAAVIALTVAAGLGLGLLLPIGGPRRVSVSERSIDPQTGRRRIRERSINPDTGRVRHAPPMPLY